MDFLFSPAELAKGLKKKTSSATEIKQHIHLASVILRRW
jgi:hypothetical protein